MFMQIDWEKTKVRLVGVARHERMPVRGRSPSLYDHNLWFIHRGRARVTLAGKAQEARRGDLFWLRPQSLPETWWDTAQPFSITIIRFDLTDLAGRRMQLAKPLPSWLRGMELRWAEACVRRIHTQAEGAWQLGTGYRRGERIRVETLLTALLMEMDHLVTARLLEANQPQAESWEPSEKSVQECAQAISTDPVNVPSVSEMARRAGLSTSHFSLLFKRFTSVRPQKFAVIWRVRHACRLLLETPLPIKAVAESLGYRDVFFFSRQFRKITGKTPTSFRRRNHPAIFTQ
jgi:AraC family transcriptional regulator of arabinose operon